MAKPNLIRFVLGVFFMFMIMSMGANGATLKIAALAPEGTNWARTLKDFAKEVKSETKGKVKIKIYYGGVAGDEPDVLRKIRVGQMHGGIFTGNTLGAISGEARVLEIPFNFYHKREKGYEALKGMGSYLGEKIAENGFKTLGLYEIGQVYVVSTKKVTSISELRGIKIWSWEGDKLIEAMVGALELVSVPLALPDVLQALSTGMVDSAYAPPLAILALQWQGQIKYLVDFPVAYSIGAMLVSNKAWSKLGEKEKAIVEKLAAKHIAKANELSVKDNKLGLQTLKKQGVEFIQFNKADIAKAEEIRGSIIKKLNGKVVSDKALKMLERYR